MTKPRIGILGTGAIGSFYGVMLERAGFEVHFLARSEYAAIKQHGLTVKSDVHGELHLAKPNLWQDASAMPKCDWVLVSSKTTANPQLAPVINTMAAEQGTVMLLQNGLGIEQQLQPDLRPDLLLLGGLCFICVHRSQPGVVVHQAYGGINIGYPTQASASQAKAQSAATIFTQAGLASQALELEKARWQKLVWNIPYNGLSVVLNATTGQMMQDKHSRQLIADLMQEVAAAASACGNQLPADIVSKMLEATDRMPDYHPSMYHDFTLKREMELSAIYQTPLLQAEQAGCAMPKVEMLLQQLEFLQARKLGTAVSSLQSS